MRNSVSRIVETEIQGIEYCFEVKFNFMGDVFDEFEIYVDNPDNGKSMNISELLPQDAIDTIMDVTLLEYEKEVKE
jgi:hypothetical protein